MHSDPRQLETATAFLSDGWHHTPDGRPWALVTRRGESRTVYVWTPEDATPTEEQLRRLFRLSPTQARVTRMLLTRRTNEEISDLLGISIRTARHHVEDVLIRLDVTSRWDVETRVYAALTQLARRGRAQPKREPAASARQKALKRAS